MCTYNSCVYILKREEEYAVFLLLYVNDILIAIQYKDELEELKWRVSPEFEMKDLGHTKG